MKHTLFIFALITASIQTFAQSPRIKLNQITKDSITGSVLISSPTDSGMVYSRDLFISYGADTVLILGGDTLAATSSIISSVLSDGVTITGDGTTGSELTVDTATVIATKQDLDLYYLDSNPDGYTSNTGTVTSVGGTGTVNGISLSGTVTSSGNLTLGGTLSGVDLASQVTGTLPVANGGTGSSSQNFVDLSSAQTVGGAKTFTSALTQSGGDVNFDSNTFFVDEDEDRVGIGTSTPSQKLTLTGPLSRMDFALRDIGSISTQNIFVYDENSYDNDLDTVNARFSIYVSNPNSTNFGDSNSDGPYFFMRGNGSSSSRGYMLFAAGNVSSPTGSDGQIQFLTGSSITMTIEADGDVVIPRVYTNTTGTAANVNVDATGLLRRFSSSIRYKTNIQSYDKGIDKVMSLNPVYYQGINDGNNLYAGFIAEQVDEIGLSEFIQYDLQGRADAISYANMTALLTKAIQEQQAIIESQVTEIETLKTLITELSNRLTILENN